MGVINKRVFCASTAALSVLSFSTLSAVLPEDRADIMYHAYDGGGADINGPSVLVRKGIKDTVSVYANYYVDMVTSATIDVEVQGASEYQEERTEYTLGFDYLANRALMSLSYTSSIENDFDAETFGFGISQDFFGDLTNLSLGFSYGSNVVGMNIPVAPGEEPFEEKSNSRRYKFGISQILTRSLIMAVNFESVIDQGFLNNPYRQVFAMNGTNVIAENEVYPTTRNSDAFSIKAMYYLPYRAAVGAEYRSFSDSWGIESEMYEFKYVHPITSWNLILEAKYRAYEQTQADFYNDLFLSPNISGEEFRARDKEMSAFSDDVFGIGVSYEFKPDWMKFVDKASVNFYWDHFQFNYDNFRDRRESNDGSVRVGEESFYAFDADVFRLFVSFWY